MDEPAPNDGLGMRETKTMAPLTECQRSVLATMLCA
jgi:hypothetical protein